MNCHLIPDEKFTDKVINFLLDNYPDGCNYFFIYNEGKKFYEGNYKNVKKVDNILKSENEICEILQKADRIFIHGFGATQIIKFFNKHIKFIDKSVVIMWGGDLYNDHIFLESHNGLCLRLRYSMLLKRRIIKKTPIFMTFTCTDYDRANKWYGANGKRYDCLYPSNLDKNLLNIIKKTPDESCKRILIGNSAMPTNNHLEAFETIKKYAGENIKVFCPLSYGGTTEYVNNVISVGEKIFGDKFIPVLEYMSINEYSQLLADIDIAILAFDRQQATANLEILAYYGAKVYMKKDCALWEHYVERDKCAFYDIDNLKISTFENFCEFSPENKEINRNYFSKIWSNAYLKTLWDEVIVS